MTNLTFLLAVGMFAIGCGSLFTSVIPELGIFMIMLSLACVAFTLFKFREMKEKLDDMIEEESKPIEKAVVKPHKIKVVSEVQAHPDDISLILSTANKRTDWDWLVFQAVSEGENKIHIKYFSLDKGYYQENLSYKYHKLGASWFCIHEVVQWKEEHEIHRIYDLETIIGRPYSLRLTFYTALDEDFLKHRGQESMYNHIANLKSMVQVCDSVKEVAVNLSNMQKLNSQITQATIKMDLQISDLDDAPEVLSDGEFTEQWKLSKIEEEKVSDDEEEEKLETNQTDEK